jgi:cell fate regulator YaaT (PSP1 superfamily)
MTDTAFVELHAFKTEPCDVPDGLTLAVGDIVVIQDEEGEDLGRLIAFSDSDESRSTVLRRATDEDVAQRGRLDADQPRLLDLFARLRREFKLEMRVVGAHWRLDRKKVCFYFASEDRLDFRALHKAVSSALNVRVAIKQIGVRDHARVLGGLGACGRELCCRSFIRELRPIALRMARQQNLFVEPGKISGLCGKLLCCLAFEDHAYQQLLKEMPMVGSHIMTDRGPAEVTALDVLKRRVSLKLEDDTLVSVALEELGCIPGPAGRSESEESRVKGEE